MTGQFAVTVHRVRPDGSTGEPVARGRLAHHGVVIAEWPTGATRELPLRVAISGGGASAQELDVRSARASMDPTSRLVALELDGDDPVAAPQAAPAGWLASRDPAEEDAGTPWYCSIFPFLPGC